MRNLSLCFFIFTLFLSGCGRAVPAELATDTSLPPEATSAVIAGTGATSPPSPTVPPTATETLRPSDTPPPLSTPLPTATRWRPIYPKDRCKPGDYHKCQILFVMPMETYATHAEHMPSQFRSAGYKVVIASRGSEDLIDCDNAQTPSLATKISIDISLSEVVVSDYDAIIYVGSYGCREQWTDIDAQQIARDAVEQGVVLGAAGCAPTILAEAGVLAGRTSAMYSGQPPVKLGEDYCQKLERLGAVCSDQEIVRDGQIVTAWPRSFFFVPAILQLIEENS